MKLSKDGYKTHAGGNDGTHSGVDSNGGIGTVGKIVKIITAVI